MMYLLDVSGLDDAGAPDVKRFGGKFLSMDDAEAHGRLAVKTGRFAFKPFTIWVRDQANEVVRRVPVLAAAVEGNAP